MVFLLLFELRKEAYASHPFILNVTQTSYIHDMDSFSDWGRSAGSLSTCTVAKRRYQRDLFVIRVCVLDFLLLLFLQILPSVRQAIV